MSKKAPAKKVPAASASAVPVQPPTPAPVPPPPIPVAKPAGPPSGIDLDEIVTAPADAPAPAPDGELGIVHQPQQSGDPVGLRSGAALADIYDRKMKLVYLIDVSSSMVDSMTPEQETELYLWTPEQIAAFRAELIKQDVSVPAAAADLDDDEEFEDELDEPVDWATASDAAVKKEALARKLPQVLHINLASNYRVDSRRKLDAVKHAAKDFVNARFDKYPDADVLVYGFNLNVQLMTRGNVSRNAVLLAIDSLYAAGGTAILPALRSVLAQLKRRPSKVNLHHIVLVSDGLDGDADHALDLLPEMKDQGVVLDFIFVSSDQERDASGLGAAIAALQELCRRTGGEFTQVAKESEFKQKFLAASARLCLPPARL